MPESNTTAAPAFQCRHVFTDGHRCGSRALRKELFCYYHHGTRRPVADPRERHAHDAAFDLPMPEDRCAVQQSIGEVIRRISTNSIDTRRAGLLLYALQIAASNLPKPDKTAQPVETIDEIVDDPTYGRLAPESEVVPPPREMTLKEILEQKWNETCEEDEALLEKKTRAAEEEGRKMARIKFFAENPDMDRNSFWDTHERINAATISSLDASAEPLSVPHSSQLQRNEWVRDPFCEKIDLMSSQPRLSYRMPAEWEPHAATWIAWPHNPEDWPGKFQPIPWVYAEIVRHLSRVEDVHILVNDETAERRACGLLKRGGANLARCHFHSWPTDRVWMRDSGPIFVKSPAGDLAITNWHFNAWAKYDNWRRDDQVPQHVAKHYGMEELRPHIDGRRLVLEGGSIDVNGHGTLITTEECLLSEVQQRNPGVSREQLEQAFADNLGIQQTIWLHRGCAGDDTHGHIDDITRFVAPNRILTAVEPNTADENHLPLAENLARLHAARNLKGERFEIVQLPMPSPVFFESQRLPASYANFYIANSLVLVPTFNDPNDRHALNIIAGCFPDREVVGIHAVDLVWGLGTLHCLSQQEPA